jgi:hypothetical protein
MAQLDLLMKTLDTAIWEMGEGFKGLPDNDVWKRPHPRLLSIGEVTCHVTYWEAISFLGEDFPSPLVVAGAKYYTEHADAPFALELGAAEIYAEVQRVHDACKVFFNSAPRDSEEPSTYRKGWTWGTILEYQPFHVAYHTGQIYSVRHLLGHETVDN